MKGEILFYLSSLFLFFFFLLPKGKIIFIFKYLCERGNSVIVFFFFFFFFAGVSSLKREKLLHLYINPGPIILVKCY